MLFSIWLKVVPFLVTTLASKPVEQRSGAGEVAVGLDLSESWEKVPFAVELLETVPKNAFLPLLSHILSSPAPSDKDLFDSALRILGEDETKSADEEKWNLEMSLTLRDGVARVLASYQYYSSAYPNKAACAQEESWVDLDGIALCSVEDIKRELAPTEGVRSGTTKLQQCDGEELWIDPSYKALPFDHPLKTQLPASGKKTRTAVLYTSLATHSELDLRKLKQLHDTLSSKSDVNYVLRWKPSNQTPAAADAGLSGYGVWLDEKKMEYVVVDDRFTSAPSESGEAVNASPKKNPLAELLSTYPAAAKPEEISNEEWADHEGSLGEKATHFIVSTAGSRNPLETLQSISQNFPLYSPLLSSASFASSDEHKEDFEATRSALTELRGKVRPGQSAFWINGQQLGALDIDNPFSVLRTIRMEREILANITSALGLKPGEGKGIARKFLANEALSASQVAGGQAGGDATAMLEDIYDASSRPEAKTPNTDPILYLNDIATDPQYANLPKTLRSLLRPAFPGQMPSIRGNLITVILALPLDMENDQLGTWIGDLANNLITRGVPVRWGFVPLLSSSETEDEVKLLKLMYWIRDKFGGRRLLEFFNGLVGKRAEGSKEEKVEWSRVETVFAELFEDTSLDNVLDTAANEELLSSIRAYLTRLSITSPSAFVNGKYAPISSQQSFLQTLQATFSGHIHHIQSQVYSGQLTESESLVQGNYWYDLPGALRRRNPLIPSSPTTETIIDLNGNRNVATDLVWIHPGEKKPATTSIWVITDVDSKEGREWIKDAILEYVLESAQGDADARVALVHNPGKSNSAGGATSKRLTNYLLFSQGEPQLRRIFPSEIIDVLGLAEANPMTPPPRPAQEKYAAHMADIVKTLGLSPGENAIIINGRLIRNISSPPSKVFSKDDFAELVRYDSRKRGVPGVVDAVRSANSTGALPADVDEIEIVGRIVSILPSFNLPRGDVTTALGTKYTSFSVPAGGEENAELELTVMMDPLSDVAQKWSSVLSTFLSSSQDIKVNVLFNPAPDAVLNRFYRYNLQWTGFDKDGARIPSRTVFEEGVLERERIYTMGLDLPSRWLVSPRQTHKTEILDLDNLKVGTQGRSIKYVLDHILLEGHAQAVTEEDRDDFGEMRGVQVEVTTLENYSVVKPKKVSSPSSTVTEKGVEVAVDQGSSLIPVHCRSRVLDSTQIIANLGYFQLKAFPGVFRFSIRNGTRGQDVFSFKNDEKYLDVYLTSLEGRQLRPKFKRQPGMEKEDVLALPAGEDEVEDGGIFGKVKSIFNTAADSIGLNIGKDLVKDEANEGIHIFTVASGLLYERFLSITILSVLRSRASPNTPVTFYILSPFLSPSFLSFLLHYAREYNFSYVLLNYNWPSFLRGQAVKQRLIWGYKILFLDVLFPLSLKRVIFVDADQIVRADLSELMNLDLDGRVWAFTPMGDDKPDVEGYRFWKTGYWKDTLEPFGLKYYISALFVVDLEKFRQVAAGDILRQSYQMLSADPNSLANLDQDLPNSLQRQLPIYELHEDWLFCATWCSADRMDKAKTIDLCQNPMTKKPKLDMARAVPGWIEYDAEVEKFRQSLLPKEDVPVVDAQQPLGVPRDEL